MSIPLSEIKLEDIDFDKVKECKDKKVLKRYIELIEKDGNYFTDLLEAVKRRLQEVAPKDYFLLYPAPTSESEVAEAMRDILEWEANVKETDAALRGAKKKTNQDQIWEAPKACRVPIRGQEATVTRPNLQKAEPQSRLSAEESAAERERFARDKSNMKDYYRAWDSVDVDHMEEEMEREEQEQEEAKRRHFEELKQQQDEANAMTSIELENLPTDVPEAHRRYMADSEKEKGNEAFYSKDYEEAEAYYSRSLHFSRDDPSTWANRALARLRLERFEGALADCDRALEINSRYVKALHRRGKALHELKRYEEAVRSFQLALAESPGNTQINGDLMVSRRMLRSENDNSSFNPAPRQRRVDDPPSCTIEEILEDDDLASSGGPSKTGPPEGYTRVMIEEDSDSDSEDEAVEKKKETPPPAAAQKKTYHKVVIEEVSGSEDEGEDAKPPAKATQNTSAEAKEKTLEPTPATKAAATAAATTSTPAAAAAVKPAPAPSPTPPTIPTCDFDEMD
mmetsp:Transcript_87739/g.183413  ORF Transcript_87739/g.183413 Transcript_87739/m.183413 type:complete len:510 (+) Transcript_87739:94-1623(+)